MRRPRSTAAGDDGAAVRFGLAEVGHHIAWFGRSLVTGRARAAAYQLPFLAGFGAGFARRRLAPYANREYSSTNGRVAGPGA